MRTVARVAVKNYGGAGKNIRRAIELLGGPGEFAARGERILVKPNLLSPSRVEKAVTTHPLVVEAVLEILSDIGAKAFVGDSPGFGGAKLAAKVSGISEVLKRHGVPLVDLGASGVNTVSGDVFKNIELSREALEADRIWNLPKWKTHSMMGLTLGVKNLYGLVPGTKKVAGHMKVGKDVDAFGLMMLDLWKIFRPTITILDGITAMEGPGPGSGRPIDRGLILASRDAPSLDWEAARLSGFTPGMVPTVDMSIKKGILDVSAIKITGDMADPMRFEPAPGSPSDFSIVPGPIKRLARKILSPAPSFNRDPCVECGVCVEACPSFALTLARPPSVDVKKCIRCYCCQELCPHGAVTIGRPFAFFARGKK